MKSVSDCLNFFDSMILFGIEKHVGIGNLEDVREYMIGMYNDKYIEDMVEMSSILKQINLIIVKFYDVDVDGDLKREYWIL